MIINIAIRISVLTISDRSFRGERQDLSGPALLSFAQEQGWEIIQNGIVPDDIELIKQKLILWTETTESKIDIILTTGGTGFGIHDVTPEATQAVIQRSAPGMAEAMRHESLKITPHAMLTRAVAGIRNHTLIVNLPGNPQAALENLNFILPALPHAVELLRDDPLSEAGHIKTSSG